MMLYGVNGVRVHAWGAAEPLLKECTIVRLQFRIYGPSFPAHMLCAGRSGDEQQYHSNVMARVMEGETNERNALRQEQSAWRLSLQWRLPWIR